MIDLNERREKFVAEQEKISLRYDELKIEMENLKANHTLITGHIGELDFQLQELGDKNDEV